MSTGIVVESISLTDFGRFKTLNLAFNPSFNLICGTNGIGKTSVLNAISGCFVNAFQGGDARARADSVNGGAVTLNLKAGGVTRTHTAAISAYEPGKPTRPFGGFAEFAANVIYLKPNRDFSYSPQQNITRDPAIQPMQQQNHALVGVNYNDIKQWFTNRWLMAPHSQNWPQYRLENLQIAVSCFSMLDDSVSLAYVDSSTFDVIVKTPGGNIPFEYLSSGFRAMYAMLLGIIKEIEYYSVNVTATEFTGIILIDELDLHLHPTWQRIAGRALKQVFPKAQIIATTHSPHIVQTSSVDEVIALVADHKGDPIRLDLPLSPYGFLGWTIEEILEDVMGLPDVLTPEYREAVALFDSAVDREDAEATRVTLTQLEKMLHPSSHLRKLFRIQAATALGADE